jgi:Ribonuclease G/E
MAKNILVINVDICETRVALIENGIIAELHLERHGQRGTLGNVYVGKVSRVLPGMQAAFIDIGQERAAFLHVEDLIRPDDLDAYLAGKRQGTTRSADADDDDDGADDEIEVEAADAASTDGPSPAAASDADEEEEAEAEAEADADAELDADEPIVDESRGSESGEEEGALSADFDDEDDGEGEEVAPAADGSEPDVPDADFTDEAEEAEEAGGADARLEDDADPRGGARGPRGPRADLEGAHRHQGRARHEPHLAARPLRGLPADGRSRRHLSKRIGSEKRAQRACARRSIR